MIDLVSEYGHDVLFEVNNVDLPAALSQKATILTETMAHCNTGSEQTTGSPLMEMVLSQENSISTWTSS